MLTVKGMGAAMNAGRKFVAKHEDTISKGANVAVVGLGPAVELTGKLVSKGAGSLGGYLHEKAARSEHKATRIAGHAAGYTANAAGLLGVGTAKVGALTTLKVHSAWL